MFCRVLVRAPNIGVEGNCLTILLVSLHLAIAEAQGEGRIGWLGEAALRKTGLGDGGSIPAHHRFDFVFVFFSGSAGVRVDRTQDCNKWICASVDRLLAAFIKLLAYGDVIQLRICDQLLCGLGWSLSLQHFLYIGIVVAQRLLHFCQGIR